MYRRNSRKVINRTSLPHIEKRLRSRSLVAKRQIRSLRFKGSQRALVRAPTHARFYFFSARHIAPCSKKTRPHVQLPSFHTTTPQPRLLYKQLRLNGSSATLFGGLRARHIAPCACASNTPARKSSAPETVKLP